MNYICRKREFSRSNLIFEFMRYTVLFVILFVFFSSNVSAGETQPKPGEAIEQAELSISDTPRSPPEYRPVKTFFSKLFKPVKEALLPGSFPSFLWSFLISAVGAYTIYGLALGPLSVLVIYFLAKGNKKEVMKSVWGWITGTVVGLGLWILLRVV